MAISSEARPPEKMPAAEAAVKRAVQMSYEKYCSATAMLAKTAQIDLEVEIVDTAAAA